MEKYKNPTSHHDEQQVIDPYFNYYAPLNSGYSKNVHHRYSRRQGWNPNFHDFIDESTSKLPSNNLPANLMKIHPRESAHFLRYHLYGYNDRRVKIEEADKVVKITGRKKYKKFSTSFPLPENSTDDLNNSMVRGGATITVPKMDIAVTTS